MAEPIDAIEAYVMAASAPAVCLLDRARFRALLVRYRELERENVRLKAQTRETVYANDVGDWRRMVL